MDEQVAYNEICMLIDNHIENWRWYEKKLFIFSNNSNLLCPMSLKLSSCKTPVVNNVYNSLLWVLRFCILFAFFIIITFVQYYGMLMQEKGEKAFLQGTFALSNNRIKVEEEICLFYSKDLSLWARFFVPTVVFINIGLFRKYSLFFGCLFSLKLCALSYVLG